LNSDTTLLNKLPDCKARHLHVVKGGKMMENKNFTVINICFILVALLAGSMIGVGGITRAAAGEKLLVKDVPYFYQRERLD
jgi:hypothetical protein